MKIIVIRHGESEGDILNVHEGRADLELTKKGHMQAEKMSKWVCDNYKIDKIYCSPLKRAYKTAEYLSYYSNVQLIIEENLMEFNNGLIAGLDRLVAAEKYPRIDNLPLHLSVYEMESELEFRFRSEYVLSKIISENNEDSTIVIVSHGGMINQLFRSFIYSSIDSKIIYYTDDTGIHEWVVQDGLRYIIYSNRNSHLLEFDNPSK